MIDPQPTLQRLQHDVAGETVGDDDVGGLAHHVAALDVADEVDTGRLRQQLERLLAQRVALAGLLADRQQPNRRTVDAEAMAGVHRAHLTELHQPLRLHLGVGTGVEQDVRAVPGNRDRCGDRRSVDPPDPAHAQQRRRHRCAGVAGRDHRRRLAVAHSLGGTHQRRVLLAANALRGVVVHGDDFRGLDQSEVATTIEIRGADENDGNAERSCSVSTGDDLAGCPITAHRVDCDRQHRGGVDQPTSTATRSLYQPQAGHTVCGSLAAAHRGHTLRDGADSFHAAARWLRVFDFDFFFLGTATAVFLDETSYERLAGPIAVAATGRAELP